MFYLQLVYTMLKLESAWTGERTLKAEINTSIPPMYFVHVDTETKPGITLKN